MTRFQRRVALSAIVTQILTMMPVLTAAPEAQLRKDTVPGINNFTRVDATVACGGALSGDAVAELKSRGYRAIINFRLASEPGANVDVEAAAAASAGIKYVHLPFNAASPDPQVVAAFLEAGANSNNQPVFVHCASANRVGAMWLIKRVVQDGWTLEKATEEAEAIGLTNPALKRFATDYVQSHGR
jgi:uncharacterized protein (TIGR01244 family)